MIKHQQITTQQFHREPAEGNLKMSQQTHAFPLTEHAHLRVQQRSVEHNAIRLVCTYGTSYPAGGDCRRNILLAKEEAYLLDQGEPVKTVEKALRLVVITAEDGSVVTCYYEGQRPAPRPSSRKRRHSSKSRHQRHRRIEARYLQGKWSQQ